MKLSKLHALPLILFFAVGLTTSCTDKVERTMTYTLFEPEYMTQDEVRSSVELTSPIVTENPGKIYLYKDYIFLNEFGKGLHIIDNSDPKAPLKVAYLNIPGNFDISAKNDLLYVDSQPDLLVFDISSPTRPELLTRYENIFIGLSYWGMDDIIFVGWNKVEEVTVTEEEFDGDFPEFFYTGSGGIMILGSQDEFDDSSFMMEDALAMPFSAAGVGGSMARFTIHQDYLYAVSNEEIFSFDIGTYGEADLKSQNYVGWGIETIFPYGENLFLGANDGMYILGLADKANPQVMSVFSHATACDPVVVSNSLAFVTLRNGTECQNFTNQLEVVDVSNLYEPKLLFTYPMDNPHGLGIDGDLLFICEGQFGLKVFDITNVSNINENMIAHYPDLHSFDVIPYQQKLILTGNDGLVQFDYSDPNNIQLLSKLSEVDSRL